MGDNKKKNEELFPDIELTEDWRWFGNSETKKRKFQELKRAGDSWGYTYEEFLIETCMEWSSCKEEYLIFKKVKL